MARRPLFKAAVPLAAILILAAGCGDHSPTAVSLESSSIAEARSGAKATVVSHQHESGTYWANIGKHGGTLDFGIGTISFPAGALEKNTKITAVTDGKTLGATFGPHMSFAAPATVTLPVPAEGLPQGAVLVNLDDAGSVVDRAYGTVSPDGASISFQITHFSPWVLAAERM